MVLQSLRGGEPRLSDGDLADSTETPRFSEDFDSTCSTPYISAPSSPGRGSPAGYYYSAPASPMHFVLSSTVSICPPSEPSLVSGPSGDSSFEFEFSSRFSTGGSLGAGSMSSADELFLHGKIRPMKLSSHLQRPQVLAPLFDVDVEDDVAEDRTEVDLEMREGSRGRDLRLRSKSLHRKARSLSPLRHVDFQWHDKDSNGKQEGSDRVLEALQDYVENKQGEPISSDTTPSCSTSSSRSSSSGRNSKKWIFLKDLLYRSKSEGRGNTKEKFWSSISFSPSKDKKLSSSYVNLAKVEKTLSACANTTDLHKLKQNPKESKQGAAKKVGSAKPTNGVGKRRVPPSAHELHYTANRAQAEEKKKRTYLPYRQGLFGCLGFSSKGYGALQGFARTLNPVSSK